MSDEDPGARLGGRLRELSQVTLDGLLAGAPAGERAALVAAFAADLEDALAAARGHIARLWESAGKGTDPLAFIDAPPDRRGAGDGAEAAAREAARMREQADLCRELATFYATASQLLPRLAEADRRRGG